MRAPRASALEAAIAKQMGWRYDDDDGQSQKCNTQSQKPPPAAEMNPGRVNGHTSKGDEGDKEGAKEE